MRIQRLEIQGFKTFAKKTVIELPKPQLGELVGIVGPNGSGKSNIADALRWVMGEQSLRLLRGKKSEDVIFSGSEGRARSSFAEVSVTFEHDPSAISLSDTSHTALQRPEITITRRLYRDGHSEYEINREQARLQDIVLLLAECGIGQRGYAVIGQGLIDQVLLASPTERRDFFDEAFGVKPLQMKRVNAFNKMRLSHEKLREAEHGLRELEAKLSVLEKQIKRLAERTRIETQLKDLETRYYTSQRTTLESTLAQLQATLAKHEQEIVDARAKLHQQQVASETTSTDSEQATQEQTSGVEAFEALREQLRVIDEDIQRARSSTQSVETRIAIEQTKAQASFSPLPLSGIIQKLQEIVKAIEKLRESLRQNPTAGLAQSHTLSTLVNELLGQLQRPAPEAPKEPDPELLAEQAAMRERLRELEEQRRAIERSIDAWNAQQRARQQQERASRADIDRAHEDILRAERAAAATRTDIARHETRREGLLSEIERYAPDLLNAHTQTSTEPVPENAAASIARLRAQLEWIGGIDPQTVQDYETVREEHAAKHAHADDVRSALTHLEELIQELERSIDERSKTAFTRLNVAFQQSFRDLFEGGEASMAEIAPETPTEEDEQPDHIAARLMQKGVEIYATPPGKRLKALSLLSGGERALTSIALLSAILSTNPPPFIVLDEVDAALDEANSRKFAEVLANVSKHTQCFVVTHNRATMAKANLLYGITMGDDGSSDLLSVNLDALEKARRNAAT